MANNDKGEKGARWGSTTSAAEEDTLKADSLEETNNDDDRETDFGSPMAEDLTVIDQYLDIDNNPFEEVKNKRKHSSGSAPSPSSTPNLSKRTNLASNNSNNLTIFIKGSEDITHKNPIKLLKCLKSFDSSIASSQITKTKELLRISCYTENQKSNLMAIETILGVTVEVTEHFSSNLAETGTVWLIIFGVSEELTETEIKEETKSLEVRRLFRKDGTNKVPTRTVTLCFNKDETPAQVYIGYEKHQTKLFIPKPLRCFHCQLFGHTAKSCRGKITCPRCAANHDIKVCPLFTNTNIDNSLPKPSLKCRNCGEKHSAGYRNCSAYHKAVQITEIKTSNKISYAAATRQVNQAQTLTRSTTQPQAKNNENNEDSDTHVKQIEAHGTIQHNSIINPPNNTTQISRTTDITEQCDQTLASNSSNMQSKPMYHTHNQQLVSNNNDTQQQPRKERQMTVPTQEITVPLTSKLIQDITTLIINILNILIGSFDQAKTEAATNLIQQFFNKQTYPSQYNSSNSI